MADDNKKVGEPSPSGDIPDSAAAPRQKYERHTIQKLRLNLEEAEKGRTWLLLPEGFRHVGSGSTYPLPTRRHEVQKLASLYIPTHKKDAGHIYLRRAVAKAKVLQRRAQSAALDLSHRAHSIEKAQWNYTQQIRVLQQEAREAVVTVQEKAEEAIASLTDLFALSRQGLDGMMRAHLDGTEWKGEAIKASAFRDCVKIVTQAVKGLGVPSEQRSHANEVVMAEAAAAMKATQETVDLGGDSTTDGDAN